MLRSTVRVGLGVGTVLAGLSALQLSANDDWDNIMYFGKKKWAKISASFTPVADVGGGNNVEVDVKKPKVVVLGSGWGALSFIQKLDQDKVDLVIISPRSFFFYTPLLAGTATGTVASSSITEPIRWYCDRAGHEGATYIQAECSSVDLKKKTIKCRTSPNATSSGRPSSANDLTISYDHLVISVGAEPATFGIPGVKEYTTFMKEIEDGLSVQRQILQQLELASALLEAGAPEEEIRRLLSWVVIGGGPTGVELTAELTDFIKQEVSKYFPSLVPKIQLTLLEATDRVLGAFDKRLSAFAQQALAGQGANVLLNANVTKITADSIEYKVRTKDPKVFGPPVTFKYGTCVWAGGIARRPFVEEMAKQIGKAQDSRFGLTVDNKMRVKGISTGAGGGVWAIGDCAVCGCAPTAQAANQQGKYLGRLFRDTELSEEKIEAAPAFKFDYKGSLAYTGGGKGVAELKSLWDAYPSADGQVRVEGTGAFAIWRSLYFSKLMSNRNQAQVGFDWLKVYLFGRDISTPFILLNNKDDKKK